MPDSSADAATVWLPPYPVNVRLTLSSLRRGAGDPTYRVAADGSLWRASRMATGPVTYRLTQRGPNAVSAQAWGDGADELIGSISALLGGHDHPETFDPQHPLLAEAHRRLVGLRVPATGRVMEALIPGILEQKVVGLDATAAWRRLLNRYGETAPGPGPAELRVPPTAQQWLDIPSWGWHEAGVDQRRATTARVGAAYADKLEAAASPADPEALYRLLLALPGIGPWTAAQVGHRALGDADALPIGDYHLASDTGWALIGESLAEADVEAFYEQWRPHRYRVIRLIELSPAPRPPRRGPRLSRQNYRRI